MMILNVSNLEANNGFEAECKLCCKPDIDIRFDIYLYIIIHSRITNKSIRCRIVFKLRDCDKIRPYFFSWFSFSKALLLQFFLGLIFYILFKFEENVLLLLLTLLFLKFTNVI